MFAGLLKWDDPGRGQAEEALLEIAQLRERIGELDGHCRTLVMIYGAAAHLAVGGSSATGLVAYATFDAESFHQVSTGAEGDEVTVVAGGQPGRYAAQYVITLDEAVLAAEEFARDGCLSAQLTWVEQ